MVVVVVLEPLTLALVLVIIITAAAALAAPAGSVLSVTTLLAFITVRLAAGTHGSTSTLTATPVDSVVVHTWT